LRITPSRFIILALRIMRNASLFSGLCSWWNYEFHQ